MKRGYISTVITAIVVFTFAVMTISSAAAEQARNLLKIRRIQNYYLAESAADAAKGLIAGQLREKQALFVDFEDGSPANSSQIYSGDSDIDFSEIYTWIEEIILSEGRQTSGFSIEISVLNKTPDELRLHVLDSAGALFDMDEYTTGELLPLEFSADVKLRGIELHTVFVVSGVEFYLISQDEYSGELTV